MRRDGLFERPERLGRHLFGKLRDLQQKHRVIGDVRGRGLLAGIEFVRPARLGDRLTAEAREVHRGGRTGIYDVEVTNEAGEVVAIFRGRSYATRQPIVKSDT